MSWCVECYDSNHVCWYFRLPVPINLTLSIVKLRNCNRNLSLSLSSWSIFETLLHLIYIAYLMAGIALFAAQNRFSVIELFDYYYYYNSFSHYSFTSIRWCLKDDVNGHNMSSPNMLMASCMYLFIPIFIFPSSFWSIWIPRKVNLVPLCITIPP